MKRLPFSCRRKSHLSGKRGSMEIPERGGLGFFGGIETLLLYNSGDWLFQQVEPTRASPKEPGILSSVERGAGATTSHPKQDVFAALKGVSSACKNIPGLKLPRPNPKSFSWAHIGVWTKKSPAGFWLTIFYRFPSNRGQGTEISSQSFYARPILSFPPRSAQNSAWFLQQRLVQAAPAPFPAPHAPYPPSRPPTRRGNASDENLMDSSDSTDPTSDHSQSFL